MADSEAAHKERHWNKTRTLTWIVLVIWALFAFVLPWNAKALNSFSFLGFPLGYYMVVQGSLIVFVLLVGCRDRSPRKAAWIA